MCHPTGGRPAQPTPCPAHALDPQQRQRLAVDALAGHIPISHLADEHDVSRKFVYQQRHQADRALRQAFDPEAPDEQVLFPLPVTEPWLHQLVLALALVCHSSYRGVLELLQDLFGVSLSLGTVHNIVARAADRAAQLNGGYDLAGVRVAAHDEIFQHGRPVLVGVDVDSTFCYLLSAEGCRDGDTWALRLLELQDRHFAPQAIVSDAGAGLRKGRQLALPEVPERGDVFHALKDLTELAGYLENRAYDAIAARDRLEHRQGQHRRRHGRPDPALAGPLGRARQAERQAIDLADSVAVLARWWREDVLAVAGPCHADRVALYQFLLGELRARQPLCPHRVGPVCAMLKGQRDRLLAFAAALDKELEGLAREYAVPVAWVRRVLYVQASPLTDRRRWQEEARLRQQLRGRFYPLGEAVLAVARGTARASSVVENLNGRLRGYFFLRRHLGSGYLPLLQFFLNHHRFARSEHAERVDKSPTELFCGQRHPHWLQMLGYELFSRN